MEEDAVAGQRRERQYHRRTSGLILLGKNHASRVFNAKCSRGINSLRRREYVLLNDLTRLESCNAKQFCFIHVGISLENCFFQKVKPLRIVRGNFEWSGGRL